MCAVTLRDSHAKVSLQIVGAALCGWCEVAIDSDLGVDDMMKPWNRLRDKYDDWGDFGTPMESRQMKCEKATQSRSLMQPTKTILKLHAIEISIKVADMHSREKNNLHHSYTSKNNISKYYKSCRENMNRFASLRSIWECLWWNKLCDHPNPGYFQTVHIPCSQGLFPSYAWNPKYAAVLLNAMSCALDYRYTSGLYI